MRKRRPSSFALRLQLVLGFGSTIASAARSSEKEEDGLRVSRAVFLLGELATISVWLGSSSVRSNSLIEKYGLSLKIRGSVWRS